MFTCLQPENSYQQRTYWHDKENRVKNNSSKKLFPGISRWLLPDQHCCSTLCLPLAFSAAQCLAGSCICTVRVQAEATQAQPAWFPSSLPGALRACMCLSARAAGSTLLPLGGTQTGWSSSGETQPALEVTPGSESPSQGVSGHVVLKRSSEL